MRKSAIVEVAGNAVAAVQETLSGEMIVCEDPPLGRREGYPLLMMEPAESGIVVAAYHSESAVEFLEQAVALLKRNFREGPHEILGMPQRLRVGTIEGHPFGLLIDGEAAEAAPVTEFVLARCEVDLIATRLDAL